MGGRRRRAAQYVLSVCHRFKMIGIDTEAYAAKVVQFESLWHSAFEDLVCDCISISHPIADTDCAVSSRLHASLPNPAAVGVHLDAGPDAISEVVGANGHGFIKGQVVLHVKDKLSFYLPRCFSPRIVEARAQKTRPGPGSVGRST